MKKGKRNIWGKTLKGIKIMHKESKLDVLGQKIEKWVANKDFCRKYEYKLRIFWLAISLAPFSTHRRTFFIFIDVE